MHIVDGPARRLPGTRRGRWIAGIVAGVVVLAAASVVTGVALRSEDSGAAGVAIAPEPAIGFAGAAPGAPGLTERSAAPMDAAGSSALVPTDPAVAGQDVIRTVRMSVQVQDALVAAGEVRAAATAAGGFVADERSGTSTAGLTLRVPTERVDAITARISDLGTVTSRGGQAQDVGGQVADLDGRIAAQQASVARVRALLDRATTISEIVSVESELASREAALESLQRRAALLSNQVSLATVEVALSPLPVVAPPAAAPGGFLGGLAVGWEGLRAIGLAALAALGFVVPLLPVVAVLVGIGWLVRRALRHRRSTPPPAPDAG